MSSMRGTITRTLCVLAACLLPLAGMTVYFSVRSVLLSRWEQALSDRADAMAIGTEVDDGELEVDDDIMLFAGFAPGARGDFYAVRTLDGKTLLRSASLGEGTLPKPPEGDGVFSFLPLPDGRPGLAVSRTFKPGDDDEGRYGTLRLVVQTDITDVRRTLHTLAVVLASAGVIALLVAIIAMRWVLRRGLRPLDDLAAQLRQTVPGQHAPPMDAAAFPEELTPVVHRLNGLLDRVESSLARERRFSSHAAHELRTPLAELRATAELIATWPDEASPERHCEMLDTVLELENLLDRLSLLSRTEAAAQPVQTTPVNLAESIASATTRVADGVAARKLTLATTVSSDVIQTDAVLWSAIVTNLVGNAVSHAPVGSTIQVQATSSQFSVSNPAPGLTQEDVHLLFERFWRKSHQRDIRQHSGLGLSIVAACCESLGAKCNATLDAKSVLHLVVTLPG